MNNSPDNQAGGSTGRADGVTGAPDVIGTSDLGDTVLLDDASVGKQASLWSDAWKSLRKNPYFLAGTAISALYIIMAIAPQLFTRLDPLACDVVNARKPPGDGALLGFDSTGCNVYAQAIHSARPSMTLALFTVAVIAIIGTAIGAMAGYYGGWIDTVLSRMTEVFYGIPTTLGAMILLQSVFPDTRNAFTVSAALIAFGWMTPARLVRASVMSVRESDYVLAARALGASVGRIITRHVLPNAIAPLVVYLTIAFGSFIAAEATLSFLGIGFKQPSVTWGVMINSGSAYLRLAPHIIMTAGLFVSGAVLGFILMGDALRDALDPKGR